MAPTALRANPDRYAKHTGGAWLQMLSINRIHKSLSRRALSAAMASLAGFALAFASTAADSCDQGARAFFIKPLNHSTVKSPFQVIFGAEGVEVKAVPAGRVPENMGHHDLLINEEPVAEGVAIPADKQHIHFDHGESRGEVSLPPGNYTLTLQFADGLEHSHGPDMSATIQVTVQ